MKNKQSLNRINKKSNIKEGDFIKAKTVGILVIIAIVIFVATTIYYIQFQNTRFENINSKMSELNKGVASLSEQISDTNKSLVRLYNNDFATGTITRILESMVVVVTLPLKNETDITQDAVFTDDNGKPIGNKGAGFFISCDGQLFTAAHVIKGSKEILIITGGGLIPAKVDYFSESLDIAVLNINQKTTPVELGNRDEIQLGRKVLFTGFPLGGIKELELAPITNEGAISFLGFFSRLGQNVTVPTMTINAFVNHGNSGGPVYLSDTGEVIGVISERFEDKDKSQLGIGVATAVVKDVLPLIGVTNIICNP